MSEAPYDGPLIIGLTGSIGMGKSTAALMLRELDVPVFDADAEVHRLQGPGGALLEEIESAFPGTTGADGVDRKALSARVFDDDAAMKRLEGIVHPAVGRARQRFLDRNIDAPLICFDIPLLFETGSENQVDVILVVTASAEEQKDRVLARRDMTRAKFESILKRQMPDAEKRARADFVIDNGGAVEATFDQLREIIGKLRTEPGKWLASRQARSDID